jgi:putative redox protein
MALRLEGRVELVDGMTFRGMSGSGHAVLMDAEPAVGGQERGPRPMETLLLAFGGCTGMDVISILRKMRQDVGGYEVRLVGNRTERQPMVFTDITVEHVVRGRNLSLDNVRRAVELSATRYCPISAMLTKGGVHLIERYRMVDEATGQEQTGVLEKTEAGAPSPGRGKAPRGSSRSGRS